MKRIWTLVVVTCVATMPLWAVPTLIGTSGYVLQPNAAVVPMGQCQVAAGFVQTAGTNALSDISDDFYDGGDYAPAPCEGQGWDLRLTTGLTAKGELGLGYQTVEKDYGTARAATISGKYQLYQDAKRHITGAVGLTYRHWSSNLVFDSEGGYNPYNLKRLGNPSYPGAVAIGLPAVTSLYAAVDKAWTRGNTAGVITVGVTSDRYSQTRQESYSGYVWAPKGFPVDEDGTTDGKTFVTPFIGATMRYKGYDVLADYKPHQEYRGLTYQADLWSLAVRKQVNPSWTVTAGISNGNIPFSDSKTALFVDAAYQFGK